MRFLAWTAGVVFIVSASACTDSSPEEACDFDCRKDAFFELTIDSPSDNTYSEVMRLKRGVAPDEARIQHDLDRMNDRLDTSDFKLPGILWMMLWSSFLINPSDSS